MSYEKLQFQVAPEQSAVIPFRVRQGEIEVLLVTTRTSGKWIVPKGWIEEDLAPHRSAEKEALEEAGVKGSVSATSLGCYRHGQSDVDPIVEVFLMRVERELPSWEEQAERTRRWVTLEEAYTYVEEEGLKSMLDEAAALMRRIPEPFGSPANGTSRPARPEQNGHA